MKIGGSSPRTAPSQAEGGEQHVARAARRSRAAACVTVPVQKADSAAGAPSVRCPPTTGTPSRSAAHASPSSTRSACVAVGADERVDERERAAAHGAHVGHVGGDRRGAGRERVGREQRGRDGLAAEHEPAVAVRDERGVVAVEGEAAGRSSRRSSRLACRPGAARTAAAR